MATTHPGIDGALTIGPIIDKMVQPRVRHSTALPFAPLTRLTAARLSERVNAERVNAERVNAERVNAERVNAERVNAERVNAERV
jgi:hypothetical protein